jgi:hypothetical protein
MISYRATKYHPTFRAGQDFSHLPMTLVIAELAPENQELMMIVLTHLAR